MKKINWSALIIIVTLSFAQAAFAALGENENSVSDDAQAFSGHIAVAVNPLYKVHEISMSGTKVREYVSSTGKIFGVAWRGRVHPDLKVLLGSYYNEYDSSSKNLSKKGRAPTVIKNTDLHFERSGHMRDLRGRAFLTTLIPDGLTDSVVQ